MKTHMFKWKILVFYLPILCISFLVGQWIFFFDYYVLLLTIFFVFLISNLILVIAMEFILSLILRIRKSIGSRYVVSTYHLHFFYIQKRKSFHACKACMHESIQMLLFTIIDLSFAYICVYVLLYIGKFDHQFTISYSFLSFIFFWIWNQQKTTTTTRAEIWMKWNGQKKESRKWDLEFSGSLNNNNNNNVSSNK